MPDDSRALNTKYQVAKEQGVAMRRALFLLECVLGIALVILIAALVHWVAWLAAVAVLLYLLVVMPIALQCGFWQAVIVSFSAVVAHSFFVTRQAHFHAGEASANTIALLSFVLVALAVSRLSARVTAHAQDAEALGERMKDLYEFTLRTLQMDLHVEPGARLVELILELFPLEAVAIYDADLHRVYQAGKWGVDTQEITKSTFYFESMGDDLATGISRRVVRLGAVPVGSLVLRGETSAVTNDAIASLIAITFDRYRAMANENRIESERRTEQLRSTVLDSLAHAYKTPLTAIKAASSGLGEIGKLSAGQAELVSLIDEQTSLLSELTTRLLTTARLDAEEVAVHSTAVNAGALIEEVLSSCRERLRERKIITEIEDEDDFSVCCDRQMMSMLLTQYVDNACKYSYADSVITLYVARKDAAVIFSVHSYGPVIPLEDKERIFERYYRSSASSMQISGTGIGLAVAKRVVQMHGGYVWVTSSEEEGTRFYASIPAGVGGGMQ